MIESKVIPNSRKLERAVLGALLVDRNSINDVMELVQDAGIFYESKHQAIFNSIIQLYHKGEAIDMLTVVEQLRKNGKLDFIGGPVAIAELTFDINSGVNIETHIRKLQEAYMKREVIATAEELLKRAFDPTSDALELMASSQSRLINLAQILERKQDRSVGQILGECITDINEKMMSKQDLTGIPSACSSINRITAGWQKSDLIICAARPGMGKTAFAIHEAWNAARNHGIPVGIFSLEMSDKQLVNRFISTETLIDSNSIRRPSRLNEHDFRKISVNTTKLGNSPMYIDDTAGISILQLRARATKWKVKYDIQFLVVDYLQLICDPSKKNREQEISSIARQLKELAKELQIPIIALSQLSRMVEARADKRPMLSDLRESGAIEQDADLIMFLLRPEYYGITETETGDPTVNLTEVIIAKHRNGSLEDIPISSDLPRNRYADLGQLPALDEPAVSYNYGHPSSMPASNFDDEVPW